MLTLLVKITEGTVVRTGNSGGPDTGFTQYFNDTTPFRILLRVTNIVPSQGNQNFTLSVDGNGVEQVQFGKIYDLLGTKVQLDSAGGTHRFDFEVFKETEFSMA